LSKDDFYEDVASHVYDALKNQDRLPAAIYLQVWSKDPQPWMTTSNAINTSISNLIDRWRAVNASPSLAQPAPTPLAPVIGVLGGLGLMLLGVALIPPLRGWRDLRLVVSGPLTSTLVGWTLASLGVAAVTHTFLFTLVWWDLGVSVLIGSFCGPLLRMSRLFDEAPDTVVGQ
jgi:hypothetical protein